MANKVEIKTIEELNAMHTGTLMKRRDSLLKCEESFEVSDRHAHETKPSFEHTGLIEFKDTHEWKSAYSELKFELSKRENIPNKMERKEMRQQKAKRNK